MKAKEKELLQSLYLFYADDTGCGSQLSDGDQVTYENPGAKHHGETGTYKGKRADDGKLKIQFDNSVLFANPKYIKKPGKPKNFDRLLKILNQMVEDGDLSKSSRDQFIKELNIETKLKELDPYSEESWEDEVQREIFRDMRKGKPRHSSMVAKVSSPSYDPCGGGRSSYRSSC